MPPTRCSSIGGPGGGSSGIGGTGAGAGRGVNAHTCPPRSKRSSGNTPDRRETARYQASVRPCDAPADTTRRYDRRTLRARRDIALIDRHDPAAIAEDVSTEEARCRSPPYRRRNASPIAKSAATAAWSMSPFRAMTSEFADGDVLSVNSLKLAGDGSTQTISDAGKRCARYTDARLRRRVHTRRRSALERGSAPEDLVEIARLLPARKWWEGHPAGRSSRPSVVRLSAPTPREPRALAIVGLAAQHRLQPNLRPDRHRSGQVCSLMVLWAFPAGGLSRFAGEPRHSKFIGWCVISHTPFEPSPLAQTRQDRPASFRRADAFGRHAWRRRYLVALEKLGYEAGTSRIAAP